MTFRCRAHSYYMLARVQVSFTRLDSNESTKRYENFILPVYKELCIGKIAYIYFRLFYILNAVFKLTGFMSFSKDGARHFFLGRLPIIIFVI